MGKVVFGIILGALMMHAVPTVVADMRSWDPSGAGGAISGYS